MSETDDAIGSNNIDGVDGTVGVDGADGAGAKAGANDVPVASDAAGGKRAALVAAVALALVVALGAVGYGALSSRGAGGGNADEGAGGDAATARGGAPLLEDYDAAVYAADGTKTTLSDIAAGRPLVINFWATWCPYCVQEMPDYLEIYREYGDRVAFAFVDCPGGRGETQQKAASWLSENGFSELPAYFDNDLEATSAFGARSLPTTVVVAANGEVVGVTPGRIDVGRLRSALDSLA